VRKSIILWVVAILLVASAVSAFADYDRAKSVAIMRANVQGMRGVRGGMESDDYLAIAAGFATMGSGSKQLLAMDPPKGSEGEWQRIHSALVDAAFEGIIAAGKKDKAGAQAALDKIGALNKEGHRIFQ
jgi:hypothetical protein